MDPAFATLTPDLMLDALERHGWRGDGRVLQLNSYENRVLQVHLEDGSAVVAKFYRPQRWSDAQILEEHQFAQDLQNDEVPVVAPLRHQGQTLLHHAGMRFAVSPRQGGRAPELEDPEVLRWIGRYLARIHLVGQRQAFVQRVRWDSATPARDACDWLEAQNLIPPAQAAAWLAAARQCVTLIAAAFAELPQLQTLRLHGDCHPGNILWTPDQGPHFVDLDDAVMGPAVQDLWMLLPGERHAAERPLQALLEGYESVRPFDRRELALIEALRTQRMIHHSAWLARRWEDPAFPAAFPWFGTPNYWSDQTIQLREQLEAMSEAADTPPPARPYDPDDEPFEFDKGFK
ncbi:serine/threonine protein kinase [Roseateles sp. BYS180W]|uniref:Stress response kinase A n=1 Tax=Roseateles rivi TaxID=3299028 RepID=A0ABW7FXF6_9BURK